jgi:hypothetical protein
LTPTERPSSDWLSALAAKLGADQEWLEHLVDCDECDFGLDRDYGEHHCLAWRVDHYEQPFGPLPEPDSRISLIQQMYQPYIEAVLRSKPTFEQMAKKGMISP